MSAELCIQVIDLTYLSPNQVTELANLTQISSTTTSSSALRTPKLLTTSLLKNPLDRTVVERKSVPPLYRSCLKCYRYPWSQLCVRENLRLADFGHCERLTAAKQRVSFDQLMNFSAHWRHRHFQKLIQPRGLRAPEVILG